MPLAKHRIRKRRRTAKRLAPRSLGGDDMAVFRGAAALSQGQAVSRDRPDDPQRRGPDVFEAQPVGTDRGRGAGDGGPEIFFEHDSASFGNKMMWIPVALGAGSGAAAGIAGLLQPADGEDRTNLSPRPPIVANGLQGVFLHGPGHLPEAGADGPTPRYNMEMGPPLPRAAAGPRWWAAWGCSPPILRRRRSEPEPVTSTRSPGPVPRLRRHGGRHHAGMS